MKENIYPVFDKLLQVGFVVKNLRSSVDKFLNKYGIGPWYLIKFTPKNVKNMQMRGINKNYSMNIGVCPIGGIRFEVIEPIDESIYSDYLNKYGEGIIHHLKFGVDNYFESLEYLKSIGIKVLQHGEQLGKKGKNIYTYLNTIKSFGFISEIAYVSNDFIKPEPDFWYPKGQSNTLKPIFIRPTQIGIVVNNLEEKVNEFRNFFKLKLIEVKDYSNKNINKMYVHNIDKDYSMKIAFFNLGNFILKIIEPLGQSIYKEFYDNYGEDVIHHIRMEVEDYNQAIAFFKLQGIKVLQSGLFMDKINFAFIETDKDINFITEITESSNAEISKYCP